MIGRPDDSLGDARRRSAPLRVEDADGHDLRPGRGARDPDTVVGVRGDHSRDVCAVAAGVDLARALRVVRRLVRREVEAGHDRAGEVLVRAEHAGVDDRDRHARAGRQAPCACEVDGGERPLLRAQRVVRPEQVDGLVLFLREHLRGVAAEPVVHRRDRGAEPADDVHPAVGVAGDRPQSLGRLRRARRRSRAREERSRCQHRRQDGRFDHAPRGLRPFARLPRASQTHGVAIGTIRESLKRNYHAACSPLTRAFSRTG